MARTRSTKREKIDKKFRLLCRDLNQVIIHTLEYNYANFRFRVYQDSEGRYNTLVANVDWHKKFGDQFRKAAYKHGYRLDFDHRMGIYYIGTLNNKSKNNGKEDKDTQTTKG